MVITRQKIIFCFFSGDSDEGGFVSKVFSSGHRIRYTIGSLVSKSISVSFFRDFS